MNTVIDNRFLNCCSCLSFLQNTKKIKKSFKVDLHPSQSIQPILEISESFNFDDYHRNCDDDNNDIIKESCQNLLILNGTPCKVFLYPEESWARNASSSYWIISSFWWNKKKCKVMEVIGTKRYTTGAKIIENSNNSLYIVGSFKQYTIEPDFKLFLTKKVSLDDYNMGYLMTGIIERGNEEIHQYQTTHFAVIKRNDFYKKK